MSNLLKLGNCTSKEYHCLHRCSLDIAELRALDTTPRALKITTSLLPSRPIIVPVVVPVARKVGTFAGNAMFLMGALKGTGGTFGMFWITKISTHWVAVTGLYGAMVPSKIRRHWHHTTHGPCYFMLLPGVYVFRRFFMNRNWRMTFVWTAAILALNNGFQLMVIYNAPRCRFQIQGKLSCCPGSGLLQDDCKMNHCFQVSLSNFIQHASLWTLWRNHASHLGTDSQNLQGRLLPAQAWGVGQDGWFYAFGSHLGCSAEHWKLDACWMSA